MYKMYGRENCKFCEMAKELFKTKDINFEYIDVGAYEKARDFLIENGHRTVPVIYKNEECVGGYKDFLKFVNSSYE